MAWIMDRDGNVLHTWETDPTALFSGVEGFTGELSPLNVYPISLKLGADGNLTAQAHTFQGVTFEPEERVFLMFGSANHDETHFPEPSRFDITRNNRVSMPFGAGPHFCAGAAASHTLVADVALPMAVERLSGLRLLDAVAVQFAGWAFRGALAMPAAWETKED